MRSLAAMLLLALPSFGGDPEGSASGRLVWGDPDGGPAGTFASAARPVTGELEEAWNFPLPGAPLHPPLHAGGRIYLVVADSKPEPALLALDLWRGGELARLRLPRNAAGSRAVVAAGGTVIVPVGETALHGYRHAGRSFNKVWVCATPPYDGIPMVRGNEIFLARTGLYRGRVGTSLADSLQDLSSGRMEDYLGRPAVRGNLLFALGMATEPGYEPSLHLEVFDLRWGTCLGRANVGWLSEEPGSGPGRVLAGEGVVYVEGPRPFLAKGGTCRFASLSYRLLREHAKVEFGEPRLRDHRLAPALCREKVLSLDVVDDDTCWMLWGPERGIFLARRRDQPDLFEQFFTPIVLGDVVYFGTWAADLQSRRILWRMPPGKLLWNVVPAERRVLSVGPDRVLRAWRERRIP
jgi:hypothetical protein